MYKMINKWDNKFKCEKKDVERFLKLGAKFASKDEEQRYYGLQEKKEEKVKKEKKNK